VSPTGGRGDNLLPGGDGPIPCLLNSNPETIIEIYIKKTLYMIIE
jgi:hypothetical protein